MRYKSLEYETEILHKHNSQPVHLNVWSQPIYKLSTSKSTLDIFKKKKKKKKK